MTPSAHENLHSQKYNCYFASEDGLKPNTHHITLQLRIELRQVRQEMV